MNSIAMLFPASTHFLAAALKPILLIARLTEYLPFISVSYSVLDIGYILPFPHPGLGSGLPYEITQSPRTMRVTAVDARRPLPSIVAR